MPLDPVAEPTASSRVVAYARVSSADQRDDLERQAGRVVFTSLCARLYGRGEASRRAAKAVAVATADAQP
jgi:predicted site-specific integrase-resolvase